jgi:hypothetical protein
MIHDHDRSGYFGASDVERIVGNWSTKTFTKWWMVKEGLIREDIVTDAMLAGTHWEHRILEFLHFPMVYDRQIIIEPLKLRVNLDGECNETIYECKTYKNENGFKVPKKYLQQVWVQMYATGFRRAYIVAYGLQYEDYDNYYRDIDEHRLSLHEVDYNEVWIAEIFLPRLEYLAECLMNGKFPLEEEWQARS